jgi:hypothetical protein
MNTIKTRSFILWCVLYFSMLVLLPSHACADKLLSLSDYGFKGSDLTYPEKREGVVTDILRGNRFVLNEKVHFICRETEINGKPVDQVTLSLIKGSKVKVERYRLGNGTYFVSSLTVKQ